MIRKVLVATGLLFGLSMGGAQACSPYLNDFHSGSYSWGQATCGSGSNTGAVTMQVWEQNGTPYYDVQSSGDVTSCEAEWYDSYWHGPYGYPAHQDSGNTSMPANVYILFACYHGDGTYFGVYGGPCDSAGDYCGPVNLTE